MKMLLIDTCGAVGTIALAEYGESTRVVRTASMPPRSSSEALMPAIRLALEGCGWHPGELAAVTVVHGPGSFTGVRTGLSVGKGLCEALGIPLVTVSRLAVLARGTGLRYGVLDAGRAEVYVGQYRDGVKEDESLMTMAALHAEMLLCPAPVVFCEEKLVAELAGFERFLRVAEPAAEDALDLALAQLRAGTDDVLGDANYVRCTDAEIFAKPMGAKAR